MRSKSLSRSIFAHRGASANAPENTLAAFRLAHQAQADGIELDVHLSADQQVVVIHDDEVSRTTNGQGKVSQLTLEELRRLDAGQGETIPTLGEVLDLIGDQLYINIELKGVSRSASGLAEAAAALVNQRKLNQTIIYSSFDPLLLFKTRRVAPQAKLGLLIDTGAAGTATHLIFAPLLRPWSLHPHFSSITPRFLQRANINQQAIITWTVNKTEEMRRLFALGIQGIITDDPEKALEVRKAT